MSSLTSLKSSLLRTATNLRGWRTRRKLVIFESDDWGAIRMPGPQAYEKLLKAGIGVDRSLYDRLDCLENRDDFQALMNVLDDHRDSSGRPAVFTFNTVMGNPDFEAIERDGFDRFHHQHLFDSYRYYHGEDLEPCWQEAMAQGLIKPQFHAREHLNSPLWMRDLRAGHAETCLAFDHRFYGMTTTTSSPRQVNYLAAFWAESSSDLEVIRKSLDLGIFVFEDTFGFASQTFIPCNYVFPFELENTLAENNIRLIQGQRGNFVPSPHDGKGRVYRSFTGKTSPSGLICTVRNVKFEPFEAINHDWLNSALHEISQSFLMNRPAIISTHRVNYSSGMSMAHRDRSLQLLDNFLKIIFLRWPEAEVITSDQLLSEMESS